ncbi:MAG: hypothetical protein B7X40_08180 [Cellulomonas sp. 14-74-6]|jgi:hypothetical protein|nr:MAG: hypothetical protein B7X40_08180 [Cellulomonas sp. 14-74-6]
MRWTVRTALAGTAGVALIGAGALTAAYAATGSPQPAPSAITDQTGDPQVVALNQEAHDLQEQLARLEAAAAQVPAPVATAAAPGPVDDSPAPAPDVAPVQQAPTVAHEPEQPENESGGHESAAHDGSGSDD